jgi:homospermidine synthase
MFDNPTSGLCLPDDIDHDEILKVALPYLGEFVSKPSEWNPLSDLDLSLMSFDSKVPSAQDMWQFSTFAAGTGLGRS